MYRYDLWVHWTLYILGAIALDFQEYHDNIAIQIKNILYDIQVYYIIFILFKLNSNKMYLLYKMFLSNVLQTYLCSTNLSTHAIA